MKMSRNSNHLDDASRNDYLLKHNTILYIEDAISQLLECKDDNQKIGHCKFLADYFRSVHNGTHILFREFDFVRSTPHNRSCFVKLLWSSFRQIASQGELLSVKEYHSLLSLLCPDFPLDIVQQTARIVLMDDALDCLMSFTDFLYAFQIQFYYEEYVNACKESYDHLLSASTTVVVPSTESWNLTKAVSAQSSNSTKPNEGVNSQSFYDTLEKACGKLGQFSPQPSLQHVKCEVGKLPKVTFYGLLSAMSKSDDLNEEIGVLPCRDCMLDGADSEVVLGTR